MLIEYRVTIAMLAIAAGMAFAAAMPTFAQDKSVAAAAKADDLTEDEKKERDLRKTCKVAICAAMRTTKPGEDIVCNVIKSWRKEHLDKMVSKAKVSWPWGRVRCVADIKLRREMLFKAMGEPKFDAQIDKHAVSCEVEREKEAASNIKFEFSPKVTFENGKAIKASLNWGTIDAPALIKGAMWTATFTDNTFNVLQGTLVEDINDFVSARCDEIKDEWAGK